MVIEPNLGWERAVLCGRVCGHVDDEIGLPHGWQLFVATNESRRTGLIVNELKRCKMFGSKIEKTKFGTRNVNIENQQLSLQTRATHGALLVII